MKWIIQFFNSSIGRKIIMSLTGLFLVTFLIVHLIGNLQLLKSDGGVSFNVYAYFMTNNPVIKFVSYGLYALILLHAIQGLIIAWKNKKAKGPKYAVSTNKNASWASKNMAMLGVLILVFIGIHMGDFWFKMKFGGAVPIQYSGVDHQVKDLYTLVEASFSQWWIVAFYLLSMVGLFFHLQHGFQSAFQTLGINHPKYTPSIKWLGNFLAIILPIGFAIIPIYYYFFK